MFQYLKHVNYFRINDRCRQFHYTTKYRVHFNFEKMLIYTLLQTTLSFLKKRQKFLIVEKIKVDHNRIVVTFDYILKKNVLANSNN